MCFPVPVRRASVAVRVLGIPLRRPGPAGGERHPTWWKSVAHAHCDLPCGVYDPAQALIEAQSVKAILEKYAANEDPAFRARAIYIKEQRSELVKHHLWVLWTDYFKPEHLEKYPNLHDLFWKATKAAGAGGAKGSVDPATGKQLLDYIDQISEIFWETKKS